MALRTIILCTGLSLSVLVACGGSGKKYLVPVDSPEFKPFEAPEDDEFDGEDDDWDSDDDDDDDDDDGTDATEPVAPVPTPDPPAKTTKVEAPVPAAPPKMKGGGAVKAVVAVGESKTTGDLDKNIIRRYMRRKVAAIRTCYERELVRNPKLAGTVRTVFTIMPTGAVKDVASSGMAVVDACVGKVVGRIVFPKPKNGGTVRVSYPFNFSSSP